VDLDLKNLLGKNDLSRKEKVLILIAAGDDTEKSVSVLRELAVVNGLREVKKWNLSQILKDLGSNVARLPEGWILTTDGKSILDNLRVGVATPTKALQPTLRKYASGISDSRIRAFVEEAISAIEYKLLRSAVVLSWVGAVSVLYQTIVSSHLTAFNQEATKRFPKWKPAKNEDDLTRMKEYDFLQVLHGISLIGKNTKDELEGCLKLRNTCGHPNSHKLGEHRVTAYVETLILNVFSKYVI
jgi:hypothetical protein